MRTGQRARAAVAGAVVASVVTGGALLGGGSAAAATPTPITCSIDVNRPTAPVSVAPGSSVQLVIALPILGTVNVGDPQTVSGSGAQTLQGTLTSGFGGVVKNLCEAAVTIQSAVPLPPVTVPALPTVLPPVNLQVPALPQLPAAGGAAAPAVGSGAGATPQGGSSPQAGGTPQGGSPAAAGSVPGASPTYTGSVDRAQMGDLLSQVTTSTATQYSFGRVPLYSYAGTPYAVAGGAGRGLSPSALYGSSVPGYAPQFGILGSDGTAGPADGVARASQVESLGAASTPGTVGIATLLAVLLLSGTSATLVRTVVLRRTAPVAA
ncbi:hypothetical protein RHODO2019_16675 [Rhodococcus antarcticus]|uniref:Uncharacterized protein n=1 Tax=Rhodococcus antarcticus TaxID=2987751 RepID=A0ABY6NZS4_9NOCA|nr:hypothetical protein [Rhodococcus antarcticus]UZJ24724.1 hypothetical protein RHODO2019_16675 [Rhodococcus antarcticus]